jgi:hypothetical protein
MGTYQLTGGAALRKRVALLLTAIGATAALYFSMASGPVTQAQARETNFCTNVTLQPLGDYWGRDRCASSEWIWPRFVLVQTYERAGCVNAMDPNYQLFTNWACTGPNSTRLIQWAPHTRAGVGIIRNNNLSYAGKFNGSQDTWF